MSPKESYVETEVIRENDKEIEAITIKMQSFMWRTLKDSSSLSN